MGKEWERKGEDSQRFLRGRCAITISVKTIIYFNAYNNDPMISQRSPKRFSQHTNASIYNC